jgi:hypothetical protein
MKRSKARKAPPKGPPNLAAKSLRLFKPKAVALKKPYTRKTKHRDGSGTDDPLPFSLSCRRRFTFRLPVAC